MTKRQALATKSQNRQMGPNKTSTAFARQKKQSLVSHHEEQLFLAEMIAQDLATPEAGTCYHHKTGAEDPERLAHQQIFRMGTTAHACNPGTLGGQGGPITSSQEFKTSLANMRFISIFPSVLNSAAHDVPPRLGGGSAPMLLVCSFPLHHGNRHTAVSSACPGPLPCSCLSKRGLHACKEEHSCQVDRERKLTKINA
ncbi:hypothetical protein AAY473_040058 [Plecturocebus cupreus]